MRHPMTLLAASVTTALCAAAGTASAEPSALPPMKALDNRGEITFIGYDDLQSFRALDAYSEPEWVTRKYVDTGKLPPVSERLPKEPLVFDNDVFKDGVGEYGGTFRHVIGGRPEGWNWAAGQHGGWGGINYTVQECLTRTGPMYQLDQDKVEPLPNLARGWEWSEDGKSLTVRLVEGAKWSDGDPFDAEDVMFHWEHNVLDPEVPSVLTADSMGEGTTLAKVDDHTVRFDFADERPILNLYQLAYRNFCPGPEHVLRPLHPAFNEANGYADYVGALAPEAMPVVTMGAWVPTQYKADELIMLRRNPYYWKVDKAGNQLPYMDEMHFKLSTWDDRTIQALAGTGDFSNMETPSLYLEALRKSRSPDFPARLSFGPRSYTWRLDMNLARTAGVGSERDLAVRDLNRELDFRKAISHALDREAMGQALVKGPFTAPHPGGFAPESVWFDADNVVYYARDLDTSKALLAGLGFEDTDGNGIVNWPDGPERGEDLEISMMYTTTSSGVFETLADSIISMLADVGISVIASPTTDDTLVSVADADYDWNLARGEAQSVVPVSDFQRLVVSGPREPMWHYGTEAEPQQLLPFEEELQALIERFRSAQTPDEQVELMHEFNRIHTENLYHVGLVSAPGALIINKRVRNLSDGVPILAYQWAEDAVIREMFYVPKADQADLELAPQTLPEYE